LLIAKGFAPAFTLATGGERRAPQGAALLHDESGDDWPYESGLVMRFNRAGKECDDALAEKYFGEGYALRCGAVRLPPRDLREWDPLGDVTRLEYVRRGFAHPGDYEHTFGRVGVMRWLFGAALPILYARGAALRLELGRGAEWNWRGIVSP
jgi:hypothetical protein